MDEILNELRELKGVLIAQNLLRKKMISFSEACIYLELSSSHLYRLTSLRKIPHYCPQGKRIYFNRIEIDRWLQQNRQKTIEEIEANTTEYVIKRRRIVK